MKTNIKSYLKESREKEVSSHIESLIKELEGEGLIVEFGKIGLRTTYALVHNTDSSIEIVGYTFLKDMKFYNESVGKLKALQQAIARKNTASKRDHEE